MKSVRLLSLFLILALLLGTVPALADGDRTVLTVDIFNAGGNFLPFFAYAKSVYPDIDFEMTAFRGANGSEYSTNELEHGLRSDIYFTSRNECKEEACKQYLIDLSAYPFLDNISISILDSVSVDGGIYLLPIRNTVFGIAYNKTLLKEWGVSLPQTYEDLVALKQKCDENGMVLCKQLAKFPGGGFQVLMNMACMTFLGTMEGAIWERDFLAGKETDFSIWDDTLAYMQKLKDIGFFVCNEETYPYGAQDENGLLHRGCLFAILQNAFGPESWAGVTEDEYGLMPFISEDGESNIYWYTPSSYFGLNSRLQELGNEKKLDAAIRVMELYATSEGQRMLNYGQETFSILRNEPMAPDSFLYDAYQASQEGRLLKQIYTTWNQYNLVVDPGNAFLNWCRDQGELPEVTASIKRNREAAKETDGAPVYCICTEDLTKEESARIVGAVYAKLAGTDAAIMSLGETHPGELREYEMDGTVYPINGLDLNQRGVNGTLYRGPVTQEDSWVILPGKYGNTESVAVLTLTGKQLKEMQAEGYDPQGTGNPFPYVITVRNGLTLEDDSVYEVATVNGNYSEEIARAGNVRFVDVPDFLDVYSDTLGSFGDLSGQMPLDW